MLKNQNPDDSGVTVSYIDTSDSNSGRHRSPFISFFVSIWARIKFLFTTALAEVCDCSVTSKSRPPNSDSSAKGDDDSPEAGCNQSNNFSSNINGQEAEKCVLLHAIAEEESDETKCEQTLFLQASETSFPGPILSDCAPDTPEWIAEGHLQSVELSEEEHLSTFITFACSTMMANVAPQTHFSELINVAAKSHAFEVPSIREEEIVFDDDFLAERLCSNSEVPSDDLYSHPLTTLGRLHNKLQNGQLTAHQHDELAASLLASTLPRNLSDCAETRKPHGANQLYAWQIPPPLPTILPAERGPSLDHETAGDTPNSSAFVESVISEAVKKVSCESERDDTGQNGETEASSTDQVDCSTAVGEDYLHLNLPKACDISYDGFQSASLDRVRSPTPFGGSESMRSKRSSSLKSERSPDDTPCRKIVRFADSLGLDLATVRQVKDTDHPPLIPASATLDLNLDTEKSFSSLGAKQFQICFPQPGASASFMHRVLSSFVCLENARVDSSRGLLTGTIRVKSVGFEKKVTVRITYDNWSTYFEIPAAYVQDSHDGTTDRFSFSAVFPSSMVANDRAQFAVRYETHSGIIYWDNNHGENYTVHCHAKATDMAGDGSWIHYL